MQGRDGVRGTGRVRTPARGALAQRARSAALALIATGAGLCLCTPGAWASGSAQGPPPGPQSGPFTQCPAIGLDTSCEYLIDVASTGVVVTQDPAQGPYDGEDDVTVAVQNDTTTPLEELHIGAAGSKGHLFEFDGDGMCWSHISPKPAECPFSVVSYDGPDAALTPESPEAGRVSFSAPLQPGQYTYFSLETAPKEGLVAGKVDDVISTTLTDTQNLADTGTALSAPSPAPVIDQAQIKGVFGEQAKGTIEYLLYSNASCSGQPLQQLGTKHVEAGVAEPSNPSSATLENNRTYYWVAKYSGDTLNSPDATGTVILCLDGSSRRCRATNAGIARRHPSISSSSHASGGRRLMPRSLRKIEGYASGPATSQPRRLPASRSGTGISSSFPKVIDNDTVSRAFSSSKSS